MGKVFTITKGLENLGALRTGGQGSVYKGKRIGEIITAVKLLPTPIYTEDKNDKNFRDFSNEVEKLKKVNEEPNPNVVKIMNSGITESGSFPFIEMEFIEGPDLEELLKPPHDPVFSIREVIKVADQLANALSHCHKVGVRHGDIKSNNVKFNVHTGNYILLDFGLAIMSDEQRRTSLKRAGAIEFMAPEQNEGQMLCETDVYSYGVIIYELLAGTVPFPLKDNGETARNTVMVSHMEKTVPDVMALRREHLPASWTKARKAREMEVPEWLLAIVTKCLEKKPGERFKSGVELHQAIIYRSTLAGKGEEENAGSLSVLQSENERLKRLVLQYQETAETQRPEKAVPVYADKKSVVRTSKPVFFSLIFLLVVTGVFSAYSLFNKDSDYSFQNMMSTGTDSITADSSVLTDKEIREQAEDRNNNNNNTSGQNNSSDTSQSDQAGPEPYTFKGSLPESGEEPDLEADTPLKPVPSYKTVPAKTTTSPSKKYTLAVTTAYLYSQPNENSRQDNFLANWNNAELTAIDDRNGFIYVVFFNSSQEITRGWLRKRDLRPIGD